MISILSQLFLADATGAGVVAGLGIFMIVIWGLVLLSSVFVIWMLIDCLASNLPTNEKILWVLVIIFLHLLGALVYFFVKRSGARGTGAAG
jgi:hypothetical protein